LAPPQSAQRQDATTTRLFRSLWLHTALFRLVSPVAGIAPAAEAAPDASSAAAAAAAAAAARAAGAGAGGVVPEWQVAAGRLAAVSPLLVIGTDSYHEGDMVERLKVCLRLCAGGLRVQQHTPATAHCPPTVTAACTLSQLRPPTKHPPMRATHTHTRAHTD
jgi:hypothetical protein